MTNPPNLDLLKVYAKQKKKKRARKLPSYHMIAAKQTAVAPTHFCSKSCRAFLATNRSIAPNAAADLVSSLQETNAP